MKVPKARYPLPPPPPKEKQRFRWEFNRCSGEYQWVAINDSAIEWVMGLGVFHKSVVS